MSEPAVVFYSDFNCPFCFALNERILALGESVKVAWRGVEHLPVADSEKSTLVDQTQLIGEVAVVRKRAPESALVTPPFRSNTRLANRLIVALSDVDPRQLSELRTRIYRAYWQEGRDISQESVLRNLCAQMRLSYPDRPALEAATVRRQLESWQQEWESDRFKRRLPALVSVRADKPILGFPAYDLLSQFFSGEDMPLVPESLAACELKPRQSLLLVGERVRERCNTLELEAAYQVVEEASGERALAWCERQHCLPDMVVIDGSDEPAAAFELCSNLRARPAFRHITLIVLLAAPDAEMELAGFDAGATDVLFGLADPKVCQARLDLHLRMKRGSMLLGSLARLDYLTELPNRRECDRKLEQEWLRLRRLGGELSVILIDIDHFKAYNDTLGHSVGDDCLRHVAKAMVRCLRRPADMLARYGGEEFIAILPETSREGAVEVAEALVAAVRQGGIPHPASPVAGHVTISAGVASVVPDENSTPRAVTELADVALYRAKSAGRDQVAG